MIRPVRALLDLVADLRCWCDLVGHQWVWMHPDSTKPVCRQCGRIGGDT